MYMMIRVDDDTARTLRPSHLCFWHGNSVARTDPNTEKSLTVFRPDTIVLLAVF
jgi:hypothetical protein